VPSLGPPEISSRTPGSLLSPLSPDASGLRQIVTTVNSRASDGGHHFSYASSSSSLRHSCAGYRPLFANQNAFLAFNPFMPKSAAVDQRRASARRKAPVASHPLNCFSYFLSLGCSLAQLAAAPGAFHPIRLTPGGPEFRGGVKSVRTFGNDISFRKTPSEKPCFLLANCFSQLDKQKQPRVKQLHRAHFGSRVDYGQT
jgi:hypothetical protein